MLVVNGAVVARGPVRSNPRRQPYDDVDLAPHLRPGRNEIGALVTRYGGAMPWYLPMPEWANDLAQGAFVLEADLGGDRWLVTDRTWEGRVLDGWGSVGGRGVISGRGVETVDARSLPADWLAGEGDWPAAVERRARTVGEPGRREPPSYPIGPFGPRPISWPTVEDIALADEGDGARGTGRVVVGTLLAEVEGPAGATVDVRTAEFRDDAGRPAPSQHDAGVTFTLDGTRRVLESFDSYGLQGVLVELGDGAVLHDLTVRERLHPVSGDAAFRCSDPELEAVWAVGRRTVSICSMDTYLDCPTREQRAWTGDSVVHQMVDLTTNTDWSLARWHPRMAASPRPDGMLPMACAGDAEQADFTIIPDWALHWVHSVWNLHRYVGDPAEIAALLPVVEGVVRWFEPFCDDTTGLPTDVYAWVIVDWASVYTEGVSASLCGLWGRALVELAEMADWLGDAGRAGWARRTHERLRAGFERLWDEPRGRYLDSLVPGTSRLMASQHGQAAAIVGRLAPEARWPRLVEVITDESALVHASFSVDDGPSPPSSGTDVGAMLRDGHPEHPWWDVEREVVRAQPFFRYVVHDALVAAGRADLVVQQCRDWRWALERCATSLTETWYGGTVSHGWSATPTRDLMQRVLGVEPAEPGFAVARVEPALGDLEWAEGSVPTPAGLVHVSVPRRAGRGGQPHPVRARGPAPRGGAPLPAGLRSASAADEVAGDVVERRRAEQRHRALRAREELVERVADAPLAGDAEAVEAGAPDHHRPRAEGAGHDQVGPPADAPVDQDLERVAHRVDRVLEQVEGGGRAVELAAAVVREHQTRETLGRGEAGVLDRTDALQHDGEVGQAAQPVEVPPREARVELRVHEVRQRHRRARGAPRHVRERDRPAAEEGPRPRGMADPVDDRAQPDGRRQREPAAHVSLAAPEHRRVHGDQQRLVPLGDRPLDHVPHEPAVAPHVDLEPLRSRADRGHLLDAPGPERRQGVGQPPLRRGAGRGELAVGVGDAGEPDRRQRQRGRDRPAEQGRGEIDLGHVAQHARRELDVPPCGGVGRQRDLVLRRAVDVVEDARREPSAGRGAQVVDVGAAGQPALDAAAAHRPEPQHRAQGAEHPVTLGAERSAMLPGCRSAARSSWCSSRASPWRAPTTTAGTPPRRQR